MKTINKTVDISSMAREELEENYIKMSTQLESANQKISWLEEQFRLNRAKKFGPSSEQSKVDFEQLTIFNEAEFILSSEEVPVEPKMVDVAPPVKRKKKGHKEKLVQPLPKEVIEYKLTSEEMDCPTCGEPLKEMKKVIRKELCVIPAKVYVKEHVQYLYACRECQKTGDGNPITSAPAPLPLFRNSLASPSLLAYVIKRKYASAMPLYRQEQEFHRNGIKLSRQTLANWIIGSTEQYLHGLYTLMRERLLSLDIIHADETRLEVLHEPGREATDSSFMWLYSSGKYDKPIVIYQYSESRAGEIPKKFLEGFSGYLQSDGYAGYHALLKKEDGSKSGITPVGCWAHCRRKFTDAHKALSKEA